MTKSGGYLRDIEDDSLVMSSTGLNDAPGVANNDRVRNYVGGEPNPVDRDQMIRSDIQNDTNQALSSLWIPQARVYDETYHSDLVLWLPIFLSCRDTLLA